MAGNLRVHQNSLQGFGEDTFTGGLASRLGAGVICDFYTYLMLAGACYQVRAGTITTPLTGDVDITDTAAELSIDAASGLVLLPLKLVLDIEAIGGTLPHVAAKSVGAVSTVGAAFVPLPLRIGGAAASSTARVAAAGGVTVAAELATTTRRHYEATIVAAGNKVPVVDTEFRPSPPLSGPASFYVQVGSVTTGSTYFGHLDYAEVAASVLL